MSRDALLSRQTSTTGWRRTAIYWFIFVFPSHDARRSVPAVDVHRWRLRNSSLVLIGSIPRRHLFFAPPVRCANVTMLMDWKTKNIILTLTLLLLYTQNSVHKIKWYSEFPERRIRAESTFCEFDISCVKIKYEIFWEIWLCYSILTRAHIYMILYKRVFCVLFRFLWAGKEVMVIFFYTARRAEYTLITVQSMFGVLWTKGFLNYLFVNVSRNLIT